MSMAEVYAQRARKKRFRDTTGPWLGVVDATDPGEARKDTLFDALNVFFRDAEKGAGAFQRPAIPNVDSTQRGTGGGSPVRYGNQVYNHTELDGTHRRFVFIGNKLYRWDGSTTYTDVTPVGVTIDPGYPGSADSPRIYCASLAGKLVVTDGANRPWVGTNLGTTPITGTYIDFDGAAGAWTAVGAPTVFGGSVAFIAKSLAGVAARDVLIWSAPADPGVGYKQSGYANFWELFQTSTDPINAIIGTNPALYYFRDGSIGAIPGPTLNVAKAAATHDSVSTSVGSTNAATVLLVENTIFFQDIVGRPFRLPVGGVPEDLSWQCRRTLDDSTAHINAFYTRYMSWTAWVPDLDLVVFSSCGGATPAGRLFVFSTKTGRYHGLWTVNPFNGANGVFLDIGGWLADTNGNRCFFLLGSDGSSASYVAATLGYIYKQAPYNHDGLRLTNTSHWDGPTPEIVTHALGYDDAVERYFDKLVASVSSSDGASDQTWSLLYETTAQSLGGALSAIALGTALGAERGVGRVEWGLSGYGRYLRAKIRFAATATDTYQRAIHSVRVEGCLGGRDAGGS